MAIEIERKFLVCNEGWRDHVVESFQIVQGYFEGHDPTVRIRMRETKAWLTIKGATQGIERSEYEYPILVKDAQEMLIAFCGTRVLEKRRSIVKVGNHRWEIDTFLGPHQGLVIAEIELLSSEEVFQRPDWLGKEVSGEVQYYNQVMANKKNKA